MCISTLLYNVYVYVLILLIWYILGIFIVAAKRTPFGTYGGKFVKKSACDLQTVAAQAALASASIKPETVDSTIIGNVLGVSMLSSIIPSTKMLWYCTTLSWYHPYSTYTYPLL